MQYSYVAKNLKGEEESGNLEAQGKDSLARLLKQRGFFLVTAKGEDENQTSRKFKFNLKFLKELLGVSLADKLFFTRNLEIMIKTGMPLTRAFEILATQTKSAKFGKILINIREHITKGDSLSSALSVYPQVFSSLFQETIKIGEETGKLDESLRILALQMEKEHTLKSKVATAMVYPIIVLCLTIGIGIVMMIFAVPKLKQTFLELKVKLPFTTRVVLWLADFITQQWWLALIVGAILVVVLFLLFTNKALKKMRSWMALKIPLVAPLVKKINSALMLRTLASLFKSGVPIIRSLTIAGGSLNNYYFQQALLQASVNVEKGQKLTEALREYEALFTGGVLEMIEVGEETGETPNVLQKLAEFYEEDVAANTERISSVIEPFMILIIGGIVGFFAISMMQPMFSLMGGIH
ncbi:MAG: type II secretion system F family protein [Candidatus Gribaldobacteria bacterium]|nr:type II secretion system F family protein [Candidatus Gribaldobacteria bacterium]